MPIPTKNNPMCSCEHRLSQHTVSGSMSCVAGNCLCSSFHGDTGIHAYFEPANHVGHMDTCRNCGKSKSFHFENGHCRTTAGKLIEFTVKFSAPNMPDQERLAATDKLRIRFGKNVKRAAEEVSGVFGYDIKTEISE